MSEIEEIVRSAVDRPCRWNQENNTIDVFNVSPKDFKHVSDTLELYRAPIVRIAEGSVTFLFYTVAESGRILAQLKRGPA